MAEITLYCPEPSGLKLGPGSSPIELIVFSKGFATFDEEDFPLWRDWVNAPGTPYIEVLDADSQLVPPSADAHVCGVCDKAFATKPALRGHLMSHAPKKG